MYRKTRIQVHAAALALFGALLSPNIVFAGTLLRDLAPQKLLLDQVNRAIGETKAIEAALERKRADPKLTAAERAATNTQLLTVTNDIELLANAEKVVKGDASSVPPAELKKVEEIVKWLHRRVWVTCRGQPWMSTEDQSRFGKIFEEHEQRLVSAAQAVGLIETYDRSGQNLTYRGALGTAVAISPTQLVTNKHLVVGPLGYIDIADSSKPKLHQTIAAKVSIPVEYRQCQPTPDSAVFRTDIVGVDYVDKDSDFAIVRVGSPLPHYVTFPDKTDVVEGDRLAVIGYPSRPGDTDTFLSPLQIDTVFRSPDGRVPFPVQRLAEGITLRETDIQPGYFRYDATTWGGNSGSIVVNLFTGEILGLHARGLQAADQGAGYNEGVVASKIRSALAQLAEAP